MNTILTIIVGLRGSVKCQSVSCEVSRLLAIDADLSAPPSSASCWRDVSLHASIRLYEVVAVSPPDMRSLYADWFKRHGLFDYVEDILTPAELMHESVAVQIEGGPHARLTVFNVRSVIALL